MNLTVDQVASIKHGRAVPLAVEGTRCVVVREDVFERISKLIDYGDMDPREAYPSTLAAWDEAGSAEDGTAYQDYGRPS